MFMFDGRKCPECGVVASGHDHIERRWRHLDTCQYKTILVAQVPRVNCPADGIHQVTVPWAEERSQFTALFECFVIDWLRESSVAAVAEQFRIS